MNQADKANKEARLPKGGTRSAPEMNQADKANLSRGGSGRRDFPEVQSDVAFTSTVVDTMDENIIIRKDIHMHKPHLSILTTWFDNL